MPSVQPSQSLGALTKISTTKRRAEIPVKIYPVFFLGDLSIKSKQIG